MTIQKFTDSEGNEHEVDDSATLLGPLPDQSPEVETPRYQVIQYDHRGAATVPPPPVDPRSLATPPRSTGKGWGSGNTNAVDSPEFAELLKKKAEGKV